MAQWVASYRYKSSSEQHFRKSAITFIVRKFYEALHLAKPRVLATACMQADQN